MNGNESIIKISQEKDLEVLRNMPTVNDHQTVELGKIVVA